MVFAILLENLVCYWDLNVSRSKKFATGFGDEEIGDAVCMYSVIVVYMVQKEKIPDSGIAFQF